MKFATWLKGYHNTLRRPSYTDTRITDGYGYCLDVFAFGGPGTRVITYPCNTQANQQWIFDDIQRLHPVHRPDLCLDISGASDANGAYLIVWGCHGGSNQQWYVA